MKKIIFLFAIFSFILMACNGQSTKNENVDNNGKKPQPETNIKVNKEYDEQGNLIRYDSLYTSFYSNIEGESAMQDSIFHAFKKSFNSSYHFSNEPFFNDLFFTDSLLMYDFYKNDFFQNRFLNNPFRMHDLFKEMDSIKNLFYQKQCPPKNEKMSTEI